NYVFGLDGKAYPVVFDASGNDYGTITIGDQIWMNENLRSSKFCNGDGIPEVRNHQEWENLSSPGKADYPNYGDRINGSLYNGYAVMDERNICPCGWRVPSKGDWETLISYLGENSGGKLKMNGT